MLVTLWSHKQQCLGLKALVSILNSTALVLHVSTCCSCLPPLKGGVKKMSAKNISFP